LLSLTRTCGLPVSYLTDGQNVPDDIAVADPRRLAQLILNIRVAT
jgi:flagellar biosynthesis protein FlhF